MINLKELELKYFSNGESVPYRLKCGKEILINPILVKDWGTVESSMNVLKIRKDEINNVEVLQMKYMDFLIMLCKEDESVTSGLITILAYSLNAKDNNMSFEIHNGKNEIAISDVDGNGIIEYSINAKEFEDIKTIILHQNLYDYDDRYIDPNIRRAIEAYNKLKMKNQATPTLEMQKVFVMSKTGMSMKQINRMTYRSFMQVYKFCIKEDLYISRNIMKSSQKYDIKDDVIHPIYEKDVDIFDEIFVDAEGFTQKIEG